MKITLGTSNQFFVPGENFLGKNLKQQNDSLAFPRKSQVLR